MKIVIIGNGPAAVHAVEEIRKSNKEYFITMASKEEELSYNPCFLAHFVSGVMPKENLYTRSSAFYQGIDTVFGVSVVEITPERRQVRLSNKRVLNYDSLLVAAGADPVILKIPGIEGSGVFNFKTLADAQQIIHAAKEAKQAVVLGGAFIGLEVAEALQKLGLSVVVMEREKWVLPRMLDYDMSQTVKTHIQNHGIKVITGFQAVSVERGLNKQLQAVMLDNGEIIPCDILITAAGVAPNLEMIQNGHINTATGILVNKSMQTSVQGIFAAGDIAELVLEKETMFNPMHVTAVKGGQIAGLNMTGVQKKYDLFFQPMNVVTLFDMSILSIGDKKGAKAVKYKDIKGIRKLYFAEDGRLTGVSLIGDVSKGGIYLSLIQKGIPVDNWTDIFSPHIGIRWNTL